MIGVPTGSGPVLKSNQICKKFALVMRKAANRVENIDVLDALPGGGRCEYVRLIKTQPASLLLLQPGGRKALRNMF